MKNLFFSLLVVGVAVAGSAFTSQKVDVGDIYVQNSDGTYSMIPSSDFYSQNCRSLSTKTCGFVQLTEDVLPSTLTAAQALTLSTSTPTVPAKIEAIKDLSNTPIKGIYQPE